MNGRKMKKVEFIAKYGEAAYAEMAKKRSERRPKQTKAEYIERYGQDAYEKKLEQSRAWSKANREKCKVIERNTRLRNPEKTKAHSRKSAREQCHKDGKYYEKHLRYITTDLQGERNKIRRRDNRQYKPYKDIIAQDSQIHHEWIPETAKYNGLALVEANPHRYGIIDVIVILDGKITLLTEEEVKKGLEKKEEKNKMTSKKDEKGRYLQLHYYVSDEDEKLILQAGVEVGRFLDICVEDAVKRAQQNLGEE